MANMGELCVELQALKYALSHDCRQDFLDLALSCRSVICCRFVPPVWVRECVRMCLCVCVC